MIKVKITNKVGATFAKELPANIHELHHALTEMGIRKTPRSILLTDDNVADVEFTADSEIGSGLLRVFNKGDTLADANTVAFAVSTAREEILTDLEQKILHNQHLTNEYYARGTSKKIRSVKKTMALNGGFCGSFAPYGYMVDPKNKRQLLANPETAPTVKRIFELSKQGNSVHQIARTLELIPGDLCQKTPACPNGNDMSHAGTPFCNLGFASRCETIYTSSSLSIL